MAMLNRCHPCEILRGNLEAIKLSRLRAEVDAGLDALRRGDFIELDRNEMLNVADEIKSTGRDRHNR